MISLLRLHHLALIASDYARSKRFYTEILGLSVVREAYRAERDSWKLDLALNGEYLIELFSFPTPPPRLTRPEATGLRHLAFAVASLEATVAWLDQHAVGSEPIRTDEFTGRRFTFIQDPDGLPIEFYEV
ncbi:SMU1112c/YaeR family gloxylase I-like metalloprotein [Hymenobacter persicinus]|uniref:VOC family protein n=1 Tax=Hymenobacter persicinus TaxID=2025506 RepID=A0A4Q5LCH0_9BACT|nr:VOC family protein [Hymenobacter persicinus]RYU79161.1 VOC family protein [Hymenobacter persicinus]